MIELKFDIDQQYKNYKSLKEKLKINFWQDLKFYVLPFMPEKFRNRVVFLPEICEPEKIYKKQQRKIEKLEKDWKKIEKGFIKQIKEYFPKVYSLKILISPTFYGTVGSYDFSDEKIIIKPRYDRQVFSIQKLIINALTHYFMFNKDKNIEKDLDLWERKQRETDDITKKLFPKSKAKSMHKVLDTEFAGRLAEESGKYLEKLKSSSKKEIIKPNNLTKSENIIFNLLLRNKNKVVSFEEISNWLWREKSLEKYSEYAITKLIERLKKKLPKNLIHNQRGLGYIFVI